MLLVLYHLLNRLSLLACLLIILFIVYLNTLTFTKSLLPYRKSALSLPSVGDRSLSSVWPRLKTFRLGSCWLINQCLPWPLHLNLCSPSFLSYGRLLQLSATPLFNKRFLWCAVSCAYRKPSCLALICMLLTLMAEQTAGLSRTNPVTFVLLF